MKTKGLTLTEMMVVLSILTIVIGITYSVLRANQISHQTADTNIQLYRETKKAWDTLCAELSMSSPQRITPDAYAHRLRFQIPLSVNNSSGEITWGGGPGFEDDYILYYLEGNYLKRAIVDSNNVTLSGPRIISRYIENFTASWGSNNRTLLVEIIAQKYMFLLRRPMRYNINGTVYIEN